MIRIGLSKIRKVECDIYLYPVNVLEIPGMKGYSDVQTLYQYTYKKLLKYSEETVELIINTKLSTEIICIVQAADGLNIKLIVFHWDKNENRYIPQEIRWKEKRIEKSTNESVTFGLCKGRHIIPVDWYLFQKIEPDKFFDFHWMEEVVREKLQQYTGNTIGIYVTGLNALLISTLNVAADLEIQINWWHYDLKENDYFLQKMNGF